MSIDALNHKIQRVGVVDDRRIDEFRNVRERDLLRNQSVFIAEGKVVLQHLLNNVADARFSIEKVLILENRLAGVADLLVRLPKVVSVFVAERGMMDQIAGFPVHRGILALVRYKGAEEDNNWLDAISDSRLVLALSEISNHDNMGSIFRNAAAFGVDHILLDGKCCHPLYRKSIRVSVGAALTVPFHVGLDINEVMEQSATVGFSIYGLTPQQGQPLREVQPSGRNMLVLGTEGDGLAADILNQIQNIRIEQMPDIDSLNVAMASGIALWHISTQLPRD